MDDIPAATLRRIIAGAHQSDVNVLNSSPGAGPSRVRGQSGNLPGFCFCPALGGEAGGGQRGGLCRGGVGWEAFDDFDEVFLGIEVLGAAVGKKGVNKVVVRPSFEASEEHPRAMGWLRARRISLRHEGGAAVWRVCFSIW